MTIKEFLTKNDPSGDLQLIILDEVAPGKDKSWLVTHEDQELTNEQLENIEYKIAQRRSGVPLAYILGYKDFYGRRFLVDNRVLVPRPETETLVDLVAELEPKSILEIGTGSGCLAITLALELSRTEVVAVDISEDALALAQENANALGAKVSLVQSDLLSAVWMSPDVIVANLPYVDKTWKWVDERQLKYEPAKALYAEDGGLAIIKRLIDQTSERRCTQYLVLEADPCQHERLIKYAKECGLKHQETKDYGLVLRAE